MSVSTAAKQLLEVEDKHQQQAYHRSKTLCIGLAWMGQNTQHMVAGTLQVLAEYNYMGELLHSLIICGDLQDLEMEVIREFLLDGRTVKG